MEVIEMEELNNNLQEETINEVTDVVLDNATPVVEGKLSGFAIGAVIATGLIAGAYGAKKLWDKHKAKKANVTSEVVVEEVEVIEPDSTDEK